MAPHFTIRDARTAGLATVVLGGEIDFAAVGEVRERVDAQLAADGVSAVEVDLAEVTFLDSSGIGALINARKAAHAAGRSFRAVNAQGNVAHVLDLTGVAGLLADDTPDPPD